MRVSKEAVSLPELTIVRFKIECPYCEKQRIYRWETNLESGVKCKNCKEVFAIRYDHHEDDDELWALIQCNDCDRVYNRFDLRMERKEITKQGVLVSRHPCDCGSLNFRKVKLEGI